MEAVGEPAAVAALAGIEGIKPAGSSKERS
jgi:hypothetical protein